MEIKPVTFRDKDGKACAGLLMDNKQIICWCCGEIFEVSEVEILEILE